MLKEYPKEVTLRDGSKITLRPVVKEDEEALRADVVKLTRRRTGTCQQE